MTQTEAIKLAIEWIEKQPEETPHSKYDVDTRYVVLRELEAALAQPEQEPVTWRNAAIRVGEDLCSVGPFGYYHMTAEQWLDWALSVVTVHAPPQRTWVGLTDEERLEVAKQTMLSGLDVFAKAIESKLKENNHDVG